MKILIRALGVWLIIIITLAGCGGIEELPKPEIPLASKILDQKGEVIATLAEENRLEISIEQIPKDFRQAVIAIEDYRFYSHKGIDLVAITRAVIKNLRAGRIVEGGSTITQQTVKNIYLTQEKTFGRKIKEAFLTLQLESRYTKKEILELYLNQIYFGSGAYGVEVAANTYFGKGAKDLTLAEGALLAGIPRRPNYYSPYVNPDAAKERQALVLDRMTELEMITKEEAEAAKREPLKYQSKGPRNIKAPFLVNEVIRHITDKYENGSALLFRGGLTIHTTLDLKVQEAAEKAFKEGLQGLDEGLEGALVAIDPESGGVRALIGGRDYERSKFNRALQAKRQPGSAFKPFLYTAAIDQGYSPSKTMMCEPISYPAQGGRTYTPTDFGSQDYHWRPFTLREALKISDNVVAVRLNQEIGPDILAAYAQKMGIESPLTNYLSLVLGTSEVTPLEIARAYGTLANNGALYKSYFITSVLDRDGKILENNRPQQQKVLDAKTAYVVTDMLRSVVLPGGTAGSVSSILARPAAGKTGTTQNFTDAWFVGYTPELSASIYIGYDNPAKSAGRTGGSIAAPIWANFMKLALEGLEVREFPIPPGVNRLEICEETGYLATSLCPKVVWQGYVTGTEPQQTCPTHQELEFRWPDQSFINPDSSPPGSQGWKDLLDDLFN